ncbi:MAG: TRAP transporter substrate-binding protein [Pararhodobacter sp.]|nr:TRAP transporter substrate-binding protein [Pararhodobacter sp.]
MVVSRRFVLAGGTAAAGILGLPAIRSAQAATTLRYAHVQPEGHATNRSALWLADQLRDAAGGALQLQLFPGGQLGGPNEMLDALQVGDLDFSWIASAGLAQSIPEFSVFSLSYLFRDDSHFRNSLSAGAPLFEHLRRIVSASPYDVELVGMLGGVPRNTYNNVRPITSPDDLRGVRLRVQPSPVEARIWSRLGASPVQLAWTEIYTGMQTGVVNGAESSIDAYLSNNFNEVAGYLSLTQHQYLVLPLLMSKRSIDRLGDTADQVIDLALASGVHNQELYQSGNDASRAEAEQRGAQVNAPDTAPFQEALAEMLEEEAARYNALEILSLLEA